MGRLDEYENNRSPERCPETEPTVRTEALKERTPRRKARKRNADLEESETSLEEIETGPATDSAPVSVEEDTPINKQAKVVDLSMFKPAHNQNLQKFANIPSLELPGRLLRMLLRVCAGIAIITFVCSIGFDSSMVRSAAVRAGLASAVVGSPRSGEDCRVPLPVPFTAELPLSSSLPGPRKLSAGQKLPKKN